MKSPTYPERFGLVRLTRAVRADWPMVRSERHEAAAGEHPFTMNQHGAVAILLGGGETIGVKPGEFEFVRLDALPTKEQFNAWRASGIDLFDFVPTGPNVTVDLLERVRTQLQFAKEKQRLAVSIDVGDIEALLAAVGGAL